MELEVGDKLIELHSEEVQEILGKPPRWILSWGITLLFSVIVLVFIGSWFIKYPDIIVSEITVTTKNVPANLVAKSSGKITGLYAKDNELVKKGQIIAVIENSAVTSDVIKLKNILTEVDADNWLDTSLLNHIGNASYVLGEIEPSFSLFRSKLEDYYKYCERDYSGNKIATLGKQMGYYKGLVFQMQNQIALQSEDLSIANVQFQRDSFLYAQKVFAIVEFETSKKNQLQKRITVENAKTALTNSQIQCSQIEQQVQELELDRSVKMEDYAISLKQAISDLKASIAKWEQDYVLITPVEGNLIFSRIWSLHQNVTVGELVLTVIPTIHGEILGILKLPVAGSGKVKRSQMVNVKFLNYPYFDYGMVRGKVEKISLIPNDNKYLVQVSFPYGLVSNYGIRLSFQPEMTGSAEIVTEDMRLIERVFNPLKSLLKSNL